MHYSDRLIPFTEVQEMLARYQRVARHPDLDPFRISDLISIEDAARQSRAQAGVYILYRSDLTLIYFGLSVSDISKRLYAHASVKERASKFWSTRESAWAQTVFVRHSWEAPSLEEFLVQQAKAKPE